MEEEKKYYAFISYKSEDVEWAIWLQHELEHYHLPASYNGRTDIRQELRPIFRDLDELSAGNLPEQIKKALKNSQNLIVVCSPRAAASNWVNQEVETFISLGRTHHIFPFIVEGNSPNEFFPPSLLALPKNEERLGGDASKQGRDVALIKIIAGMLGLGFDSLWNRYEKERIAEERRKAEERMNLLMIQNRVIAESAQKALSQGNSYLAARLALEALPSSIDNPNRPYTSELEMILRKAINYNSFSISLNSSNIIIAATLSPDEKYIITGNLSGEVIVIDKNNGLIVSFFTILTKNNHSPACIIKMCTACNTIIVCTIEGEILSLELGTWLISSLYRMNNDDIEDIQTINNGMTVLILTAKGIVISINLFSHRINHIIESHQGSHYTHMIATNTMIILTSNEEGIYIFNYLGEVVKQVQMNNFTISHITLDSKGERLLCISDKGKAVLFDKDYRIIKRKNIASKIISNATFSNNGDYIILSRMDENMNLIVEQWGSNLKTKDNSIMIPLGSTATKIFYADALYVISNLGVFKRIDLFPTEYKYALKGHNGLITSISISPSGLTLATASEDKSIKVWDIFSGICLYTIHLKEPILFVRFYKNDKCLAYSLKYGDSLRFLNITTSDEISSMTFNHQIIRSIAISSDYKLVALNNDIYKMDDRTLQMTFPTYISSSFSSICIVTDTKVLYGSTDSKAEQVKLFSLSDGDNTPQLFIGAMCSESLSQNEKYLALISNQSVIVYDVEDGQVYREISYTSWVESLSFIQGNRFIAIGYYDGDIHIWDLDLNVKVAIFKGHKGKVCHITTIPKHNIIVSVDSFHTILIWNFPPLQELINDAKERYKDIVFSSQEKKMYYLE